MEPKKRKGLMVFPLGLGFIYGSGLSSDDVGEARLFVIVKSQKHGISIFGPYSGINHDTINEKINSLFENGEQPEVFEADTDDKKEALELWKMTSSN
jgi:hypothetical protein